jgi:[CysO sulfur-carrier protein]-S-L-cysteine hydrolase
VGTGLARFRVAGVLVLPMPLWERVVAHCLDGFPLEACGLLAGQERPGPDGPSPGTQATAGPGTGTWASPGTGTWVGAVYPTANAARSARLYTVEPRDLLKADRTAEAAGLSLIGVWHSHTHTPAYPSPTDINQAPDPGWHYVLVSLRDPEPVVRSYRIVDSQVEEELVVTPA